jgi:hypothetical protein
LSGNFLYRYLSDYWTTFPDDDRALWAAYWDSLTKITGDMLNQAFGLDVSQIIEQCPLYDVSRWNSYELSEVEACTFSETRVIYREFATDTVDTNIQNITNLEVWTNPLDPPIAEAGNYTVDAAAGTITRIGGGAIDAGSWVKISYKIQRMRLQVHIQKM